jgi:putative sigma-54 modulation protein
MKTGMPVHDRPANPPPHGGLYQRRRTMQFQLTGQQIEVTPALRAHATSRLDRLTRLDEKCTGLTMVLSLDKLQHCADGTLTTNGAALHAAARGADMYASIDMVFDKLAAQLRRHRDKKIDKHPQEAREARQFG